MGLLSNPRIPSPQLLLIGILCVFLALATISAQEASVETENEDSNRSVKDLGRRGMIVVNKFGADALGDNDDISNIGFHIDSGLGVFDAFFASFSMILVSEIGDETFIIAALMAMRHPKSTVLSGALSALIVMTVLSTGLGRIVPNLISRKHTNSAATVLYAFFGLRLLYIAWRSDSKSNQKKEMEEVEEKLETGQGKTTFRRFFSRFCTPIFLESFVLTFLAEWGDRSQIATIAGPIQSHLKCQLLVKKIQISLVKTEKLQTTRNKKRLFGTYLVAALPVMTGNTQKRCWSRNWGYDRTHHLYISGCGRRKHASIQDITRHSCHNRRLALPWFFTVFLFLSSPISFHIFVG
ncbi:hypothetical protein Ddye_004833 [Dipteronia dyeriana]|uniref:GDT1 family protein n=1 Tax=Dipteronia dyeriana TaxID=168575 RepID=A0AAE0CP18_9ROSI|nr:hypothetical protein Ddye_004833 [Dipteronia dyeriana]